MANRITAFPLSRWLLVVLGCGFAVFWGCAGGLDALAKALEFLITKEHPVLEAMGPMILLGAAVGTVVGSAAAALRGSSTRPGCGWPA